MIGYFLLGLRRSGNHMFINLILENYNSILYYNDIKVNTRALERHLVKKNSTYIGNIHLASKLVNSITFSFEDMWVEHFDNLKGKIIKLFNFEQVLEFVIMRDILNCMASRLEANNTELVSVDEHIIDLWYKHFYSNYFKLNYNLYLTEPTYKELVKEKMMLKYTFEVLTVPQFLCGSSFVRDSLEKQRTNDYLNRYQKYKDHPIIFKLLEGNLSDVEREFRITYEK
jgi:hypothetical protein